SGRRPTRRSVLLTSASVAGSTCGMGTALVGNIVKPTAPTIPSGTGTFILDGSDLITNGSHPGNAGYDAEWDIGWVIRRPDGTWETRYFDETGQSLSRVVTAGDPDGTPGNT